MDITTVANFGRPLLTTQMKHRSSCWLRAGRLEPTSPMCLTETMAKAGQSSSKANDLTPG